MPFVFRTKVALDAIHLNLVTTFSARLYTFVILSPCQKMVSTKEKKNEKNLWCALLRTINSPLPFVFLVYKWFNLTRNIIRIMKFSFPVSSTLLPHGQRTRAREKWCGAKQTKRANMCFSYACVMCLQSTIPPILLTFAYACNVIWCTERGYSASSRKSHIFITYRMAVSLFQYKNHIAPNPKQNKGLFLDLLLHKISYSSWCHFRWYVRMGRARGVGIVHVRRFRTYAQTEPQFHGIYSIKINCKIYYYQRTVP